MAWDTSSPWCGLALARLEGRALTPLGHFCSSGGTHSGLLPHQVSLMLEAAGLKPSDLNLLAVGRGPGSFTGLRTGLALAKGLALGAGLPVAGLSSLEVVAAPAIWGESPAGLVAPVIDARHRQIFTALYEAAPGQGYPLVCLLEPRPVFPEEFEGLISPAAGGRPVLVTGPGLELVRAAYPLGLPAGLVLADAPAPPDPLSLAHLAGCLFQGQASLESYPPIPMYLRRPDIRTTGLTLR
ncbi:MAG: tRNA (adenosine(37)-N6)-threonylcarbamoyltransferase complex dimerization subunit type 1 TsaB [Candidatus Adiutrix sp.]|jgi:tRNA threonylcarbamoyladenosine biosynthesis protein TsaB|nr:tRNA (adenosine(37)-N6)-threonylcarbamoyltransferase complex dimerization subunit type 1 TsaB [Candidatus Adiutrix sp.]